MAVIPMEKVQILGMKQDLQKVLKVLQEKGVMQVEEISSEAELVDLKKENQDIDYEVAQIDFAIKLLKDHATKRPIWAGKPSLSLESAMGTIKDFKYKEVVVKCQQLEEKFVADQNEQNALKAEATLLENWRKLPFNLDTPRETESSHIITGSMQAGEYQNFHDALAKMSDLTSIKTIGEEGMNVNVVIVVSKQHVDETKLLLGKYKFQEVELPSHPMDVDSRLKNIEKRLEELDKKMEAHDKEFKKLAKHFENLQITHDVLTWQQEEQRIHEKLKGTDYSFIVEGWIPKQERNAVEEELKAKTTAVSIEHIKPKKDEESPILLRNKKASWPFESVTRLYGFPTASEVDPTPFLASFFIVFFALCLTDAGYGLSLFVIMFVMLRFFNLPPESKGLIKLLMWGGLVTMVAGFFFGGYFGLTPEQAPAFMVEGGQFKFQLINATSGNGPLTFLVLALILGIAHVLFGKIIDGVWKIKQKQYLDALLDSFLWIYFIIVILGFGLSSASAVFPASTAPTFKWLTLAGVAAMILTQGRKQEGILKKFGIGVLSLYGLVGYLGDVLSYSRIMALGLGTGIIAFAMNTIAGLAYDLIPFVGFIFAGIVLLLGHVMNLVLSSLGAFIHSARLQFVEFFSKFMEGGGTEFKPFKRHCKYIIIQ